MANTLTLLSHQLRDIWKHFGINQKVSMVMGVLVTVVAVGGLLYWSSRPSFRLLYSNLTLEDAAAARERLDEDRIPVSIGDSGHSLSVPAKDVYRARLLLASDGLPAKSSTGFELFAEPKFGLTDFAQQVNYQRALQGELEKTISSLENVDSAKILIVLPKETLFAGKDEGQASASIMLQVSGGGSLSAQQIRSIKQVMAGAVSDLNPSFVTITDQYGTLLAQGGESGDGMTEEVGGQFEIQGKMEAQLRTKAQRMLDTALGSGNSIVQVSVELDFSKVEKRKETYDEEGKVAVTETRSTESSTSPSGGGGGVAGMTANVPLSTGRMSIDQDVEKTKREDITTEYKVPHGTEVTVNGGAQLQAISVSVCVAAGTDPRTPEQITELENMVSSAVGLMKDDRRTDTITVVEMAFSRPDNTVELAWWQSLPVQLDTARNALFGVIVLIVLIVGSRRLMGALAIEKQDIGVPLHALSAMETDLPNDNSALLRGVRGGDSIDHVARIAEQDPKSIANWVSNKFQQ